MSNSTLKAIFDQYAGKEIKHPKRVTCDCDEVMDGLAQEVRQAGFILGAAHEKGSPEIGCMVPPNLVAAEFENGTDGKLRLTGNFKLGN